VSVPHVCLAPGCVVLTLFLYRSRSQYRKAQLTAKHNADRAKLKERELLFSNLQSGTSTPSSTYRQRKQNQGLAEEEIVAQASSDVTSALRRTHQLMQSELSRSRFAQETLEQSTAALADLGEKYSDLNTLLANSKNLVTTLLKSQKSDTWYLETTFYILITTIVWLVFRRWLYGPLTWFIFWPLKLVFRVLFGVASIGSAAATTTSLAAASSSSFSSSTLIVQPSATGGIPRRDPNSNTQQQFVRVGGGGRGYAKDPSLADSLSEHIGRMAEQQQEEQQQQQQQQQQEEEEAMLNHPQLRQQPQQPDNEGPVVRGDGTMLKESDKPRNPKKKMWEENVEREKYEQAQQGQQGGSRERDEL
jgi:protein transport protein SEC20